MTEIEQRIIDQWGSEVPGSSGLVEEQFEVSVQEVDGHRWVVVKNSTYLPLIDKTPVQNHITVTRDTDFSRLLGALMKARSILYPYPGP